MDAALESLEKLDPAEEWRAWKPPKDTPLGLKWAGHLYRRAAFGATNDELRQAADETPDAALHRLFEGDPRAAAADRRLASEGFERSSGNDAAALRAWWLDRMMNGGQPLREKMTLFWHNHFATSINKVMKAELMLRQNELLRTHALGKFGTMLQAISKDPAMLIWLDSNNNVKGKPNENYAREVMELFSLGVGNYTEHDIREAARAFTGWHTDGNAFTFKQHLHDDGEKTVHGTTGKLDGSDVVRICLQQKACARFIVRKLYRFFISEAVVPPDAFIEPLAETYRQSEYNTGALVRTILSSRHFFSDHAYRQRVKSPVEYALGLVRALGQGMLGQNLVNPGALIVHLELMGQHLFAPPNVKGWEGGKGWLNTATLLERQNLAFRVAMEGGKLNLDALDVTRGIAVAIDPSALARIKGITKPEALVSFYAELLLQADLAPAAQDRLKAFLTEGKPKNYQRDTRIREMIHALLTMPEYQLA